MKYGKGKLPIPKSKTPASIQWIDEEPVDIAKEQEDATKSILKVIEEKQSDTEPVAVEKPTKKLYLNGIPGHNDVVKPFRKLYDSIVAGLVNLWRKDTTNDLKVTAYFILLHGLMIAAAVLAVLIVSGSSIPLIGNMRDNAVSVVIVLILGGGSSYYLLLDMAKAIKDILVGKV